MHPVTSPFGFFSQVVPDSLPGAFVNFWANTLGVTGTTQQFMQPWGTNINVDGVERFIVAPYALGLTYLFVRALTPGTGGGNTTFTVRKNGVATALAVTIVNNSSPYQGETTLAVASAILFAAGDRISLDKVHAGTITTVPQRVYAGVGYAI